MKKTKQLRVAISSSSFVVVLTVLAVIIAASGYGLYFTSSSSPRTVTLTSISLSTFTLTTSNSSSDSALVVKGTLVIIPDGIAKNQSLDFTPSTMRVVIGVNNTVTWLNQDRLSQHTIAYQSVPSGVEYIEALLKTGESFTITLTVPGTYHYVCMWHPAWMRGSIIVENR